MVRHGTLDSLGEILSRLTLSNAIGPTCVKSWELGQILHCCAVQSSYYLLQCENSIDIQDLFKTKLQSIYRWYWV